MDGPQPDAKRNTRQRKQNDSNQNESAGNEVCGRQGSKVLIIQRGEVAQKYNTYAGEMGTEQAPIEADCFLVRPQCGRAKAEEDGEGDNSRGSERAEQRSYMRDTGEQRAVEGQDRGQEIETPQQMARRVKKGS